MKTGEHMENIAPTSPEANTQGHHGLDMLILSHYKSSLVVSFPPHFHCDRHTEACSTIKAILYWNVPPCGDEKLTVSKEKQHGRTVLTSTPVYATE